ncbi:MAG: hypothetical protein EBZ36_18250, partial [Acidobacteria bacterium]|nr:hypothetical protein [Acidobacteriota bacterium]
VAPALPADNAHPPAGHAETEHAAGHAEAHPAPAADSTGHAGGHAPVLAPVDAHHDVGTERLFTVISVLLGFLGIGIGAAVWLRTPLRPMPKLLEEKYYVDEVYESAVIQPLEHTSRDLLWKLVDVRIIDGVVNGAARLFAGFSGILRYTQSGSARNYAAVILIGAIIIIGYFGFLAAR